MIPDGKTHNRKYSVKYPFSSKIECGICGCNYVRRMNEKRKDGTRKTYWVCFNRTSNVDNCRDSIFVNEEMLQEIFIQIYNSIIEKKHKTKDKLLNAIKETLTEKDNKNNLDKLLKEKDKLDKRLSNLIDMKLDDYDNKEAYISKEKEINDELKKINEQIEECKIIESTNKNISDQLKIVEKMLDTPNTIKDFNKDIFENLVDKIIVGEVNENRNINSKVIRFILKIGTDYRYEINEDKSVSFRPNNVEKFS